MRSCSVAVHREAAAKMDTWTNDMARDMNQAAAFNLNSKAIGAAARTTVCCVSYLTLIWCHRATIRPFALTGGAENDYQHEVFIPLEVEDVTVTVEVSTTTTEDSEGMSQLV